MSDPPPTAGYLCPTIKRVLGAFAVALLAFLLPQELPLEWYPLNDPGSDVNLLQVTFAADKEGEVQVFYDTGRGFNEIESIRIPVTATKLPYTYTFPLPDAPLIDLRLDPLPGGGSIEVAELKILTRAGKEVRRFTREHTDLLHEIATIMPTQTGWTATSQVDAQDPQIHFKIKQPLIPAGMNERNLRRCLLSTGYVAGMLWLILLIAIVIVERPAGWRPLAAALPFAALLALLFGSVANRGLIRGAFNHALFPAARAADYLCLEMDVTTTAPTTAQIFWDLGDGFEEALSAKAFYAGHNGVQTLSFRLPLKTILQLRFDPLVNEGLLEIRNMRLVDDAQRTVAELPMDSLLPENEISRLEARDGRLLLQTAPHSQDPISRFSPSSLMIINSQLDRSR